MIETVPAPASGRLHAVQFFKDSDSLARVVAEFLGGGIVKGCPGIAIAAPAHRELIVKHLDRLDFDVVGLQQRGEVILLDARDTLATFCEGGEIDDTRFTQSVTRAIDRARRGRDCGVRVYGEAVDLLWKDGKAAAAIRLEMLWNELAAVHPLRILCGYSMGNSYKGASIEEITCTHTHVLSADGQAREIARV
jgi:hypothetical protein